LYVWFQLISEDLGLKLEKVQPDMLGSAKRVTVSKDETIILDGGGDKKAIEEQCEQVLNSKLSLRLDLFVFQLPGVFLTL
jgi:chaperonin GroEL (HSP60 family)